MSSPHEIWVSITLFWSWHMACDPFQNGCFACTSFGGIIDNLIWFTPACSGLSGCTTYLLLLPQPSGLMQFFSHMCHTTNYATGNVAISWGELPVLEYQWGGWIAEWLTMQSPPVRHLKKGVHNWVIVHHAWFVWLLPCASGDCFYCCGIKKWSSQCRWVIFLQRTI